MKNLKKSTVAIGLVGVFILIGVVTFLLNTAGAELFSFLKYLLVQGFGAGLAVAALLFFVVYTVWRLHSRLAAGTVGVFILGVIIFAATAGLIPHSMQMPAYKQTFGPGFGPDLPFKNVYAFFKSLDKFERVSDIARDPNEVPAPLVWGDKSVTEGTDVLAVKDIQSSDRVDIPDHEHDAQGNTISEVPIPEHAHEGDSDFVELFLETKEVLGEMGEDITFNYWTFNGQVPGPMLRVKEGDTVKLTITNNASSLHHHNVDLHAVNGPGGGATVTTVGPGETRSFTFKAMNPGLYVYHCAVPNVPTHITHGMYGMILVEPVGGLPPVDEEFYVMQGEFYSTGKIGQKGLQVFDTKAMLDGNPNYVVFNGRTGGVTGKMKAKVGDKIRIYFGNGGVNLISSFHVIGEIFDRVYPEGSIGSEPHTNVQTTTVPAGGATMVEFTVDYPGKYILVDHALARLDKGAWGILEVTGEADSTIFASDGSKHSHASHGGE